MINPISKIQAVNALYGEDSYIRARGDGVVDWNDGHETTAKETAAINTKYDELFIEWTAQQYARDRAESYPSVGDQLDMLMKDMKNGTTTHQTACEAVKTKFPKP